MPLDLIEGPRAELSLPPGAEILDLRGVDSDVVKMGDDAVKIYTFISLEQIRQYQELTYQVCLWLQQEPFIFQSEPYQVMFQEVVPIDKVYEIYDPKKSLWHYPVAESCFIPGPNGRDLIGSFSEESFSKCQVPRFLRTNS